MKDARPQMAILALLLLLLASSTACSDDSSGGASPDDTGHAQDTGAVDAAGDARTDSGGSDTSGADTGPSDTATADTGPVDDSPLSADDRPAPVFLPSDYEPAQSYPLVVLLHGYTASGSVQDAYFGVSRNRDTFGYIAVVPDGTKDAQGNRFWNATEYCCDFGRTGVDDSGYLIGLVDEAQRRFSVDADRVFFVGHSNGGFMSYRMACDYPERIAGIASLAGAAFTDPANCGAQGGVSVLQVHGTADATIAYDGTANYPSAQESVERWTARNNCGGQPTRGSSLDLDNGLAGDETTVEEWAGCENGERVALWTIEGGGHIPGLSQEFFPGVMRFLLDE